MLGRIIAWLRRLWRKVRRFFKGDRKVLKKEILINNADSTSPDGFFAAGVTKFDKHSYHCTIGNHGFRYLIGPQFKAEIEDDYAAIYCDVEIIDEVSTLPSSLILVFDSRGPHGAYPLCYLNQTEGAEYSGDDANSAGAVEALSWMDTDEILVALLYGDQDEKTAQQTAKRVFRQLRQELGS